MNFNSNNNQNIYRLLSTHPCFSKEASHKYGRLHLPVAKICNIKCNYCDRKYDCVNESRPGVTSKLLNPEEAFELTKKTILKFPNIKVVGIAGPGDPLANKETFETLKLINEYDANINLCLSTNGLLLEDKIKELLNYNLKTLTVTMNTIDKNILSKIIEYINYNNKKYDGIEASSLMIKKQINGIIIAKENGLLIKVNTVLIPTINDLDIVNLAKYLKELEIPIMNIMSLIPQNNFSNIIPPTLEQKKNIQKICSKYVEQMKHCRQCRADACGYL